MSSRTAQLHCQSILRAIGCMRKDPGGCWRIADLAEVACMSSYHFVRVFGEITAISPARFLAALRMEKAKRMLLESSRPVISVCFDVGYNSVGTFTRIFTQFVGLSPNGFRRLRDQLSETPMEALVADFLQRQSASQPEIQISGCISSPAEVRCDVFLGIFPCRIPQGRPTSGVLLPSPGQFRLPLPPNVQGACMLAAAIPGSAELTAYLLPSQNTLLVASVPLPHSVLSSRRAVELRLRSLSPYDPPVVIALPILLMPSSA